MEKEKNKKNNSSTIERVELSNISITVFEHVNRYIFASNFVNNKIVLDAACGTGYGSNYLSNYATTVYGIDIDNDTIEKNKRIYNKNNLIFSCGSIYHLPYEDNMFDVIISFETIEHVDDGDKVLSEFKRVLKSDGILIISTPNKQISFDNKIINPFHKHEYFENEFQELLLGYFKNVIINYQANYLTNIIFNQNLNYESEYFSTDIDNLKKGIIEKKDFCINKEYFIVIAYSNDCISDNIKNCICEENEIFKHEFNIDKIKNSIYQSLNYKIGYFITYPIKFLLNLFRIKKYPDL